MKMTFDQERLLLIGKNQILIIKLEEYQVFNKIQIPYQSINCFLFSDQKCDKAFVNSGKSGLYEMSLSTGDSRKFGFSGFGRVWSLDFPTCSTQRLLYGRSENGFPVCFALRRGFRLKIFAHSFKEFENTSNCVSKDNKTLVSGDYNGKIMITDTWSSKLLGSLQIDSESLIACVKMQGRGIYAVTCHGELIVMNSIFPYTLLYYQKIEVTLFSICMSDKLLIVGKDTVYSLQNSVGINLTLTMQQSRIKKYKKYNKIKNKDYVGPSCVDCCKVF